ncbi:MAG: hypothetical protein Q8O24_01535 [Gallionellaceae bacterium]|nr:hypothetical protein [Gallionellaceae bacterium]
MSINRASIVSNWFAGVCCLAFSSIICAAPLEDINVQQVGDDAQATIKLSTQVRFLRYVPAGKSRLLEIYYERVPGTNASDPWVDNEVRTSAETTITPAFKVTTRDQALQPKLVIEFAKEVEFKVSPAADGRSFLVTIKPEKVEAPVAKSGLPLLPTVLPPVKDPNATPAADGVAAVDNNQEGYKLMSAGRDALSAKNYPAAIEAFNKLLMLPPNQYSQDAQEWVGVSRERNGQSDKAKAEYELYLKLFTTEPGVSHVKQRLAGLRASGTTTKMDTPTKKIQERSFFQGGLSSRYYFGQTDIESTYQWNGTSTTSTYSLKDQSSLITNVDATQRYISQDYDNRIVFRDVHTKNFLPGKADRNRMNSAYVEVKNRTAEYSARLGRQTSGGGGVMGRFDGLAGGYGAPQDFRVSAVAGQLVDFTSTVQPVFYGAGVESGPYSAYIINQTLEGILDRRAVGAEYRYFEGGKTAFALLDYDIYFSVLNAATVMGTYQVESSGTSFNFMADYRKSPSVSTRNALNGSLVTSIKDLGLSEAELKALAISRTGSMAFTQFGMTQKLSQNWQLGGDIRLSKIDGLVASGCDPTLATSAQPAICSTNTLIGYSPLITPSGLDKTITAQLIGSNLYSDADMTSMGTSYITSDYVKNAQSVFIYNRTSWDRDLFFDTSWNYYQQTDNYGGSLARNMPMVRVAYMVAQTLSLDADLGIDFSTSKGSSQTSTTRRIFGSLGFRWDF